MIQRGLFLRIIFLVASCSGVVQLSAFTDAVQVKATEHAKMKMVVCLLGKKNSKLDRVVVQLQKDFSITQQFAVSTDQTPVLYKNDDVKLFFEAGFPFVLFVSKGKKHTIEWRLYDAQHAMMLVGKVYTKRGRSPELWAHHIADSVWPVLTGQQGFFSTKIAYCKEIRKKGKKVLMHVAYANCDGSNEKVLVTTPTVNVAPRWNRDPNNPLLFYSEHTNKNVRLIAVDMAGKRRVVSNFDGVNMQAAFSADGKKAVFSSSRGGGTCQLYFFEKGNLKKLTHNNGNNITPTFSDDAQTLFFCSDFEAGNPQIYRYEFKTAKMERITNGGFCVSPSYCQSNDSVAYSKIVKGTMQVFVYDLKTKKHEQVTFDAGNKDDCSWSPCGNYLLFAVETRNESRIALFNRITKSQQFVTSKGSICCYPTWSGTYNEFPSA